MSRSIDRLGLAGAPVTAATVRATAGRLRAGGIELRTLTISERIAALDRLAAGWLASGSPWRERARVEVASATGYPSAAIDVALDHLWTALRAPHLEAVARAELSERKRGTTRPDLALHVLAGNVPGAGVFGIVAALLAGVPSLVKPAAREPFLPTLIIESIRSLAPELRRAVAVATWRGGTDDLDGAALAAADVVLAYGRAATLDRIAAQAPRRLLRFGPRISVALVARGAAHRATAAALARQVALYDQQGCLSPQIACVEEESPMATRRFAALVAEELARLELGLPGAPRDLAESAAVWRHVERQRWRAQEGAAVETFGGENGRASVVCDRTADWPMSPLWRHLVMLPVPALATAATLLARLAGSVEAVGYAGPASGLADAAAVAATCGAHRLCPLERMQAPPFAWRQSGHPRLASFTADPVAPDPLTAFA